MGRPVDQRADIYALGVVLYQMFVGALPFDGLTTHEIVLKHVSEPPARPSSHRAIVPPEMEPIILACLEKAPERRPPSMAMLGQRIDAAFAAQAGRRIAAGGDTLILPLPAAGPLGTPAAGGTELLPGVGRLQGVFAAQPASTTLREATGERGVADAAPNAEEIALAHGGRWRKAAAGIALAAAVVLGVVVAGGRRAPSSPPPAASAPLIAAPPAPAGPALVAAPPAPSPPAPAAPDPPVAPPPEPPTLLQRSEHRRRSAARPVAVVKKTPETDHEAAPKPAAPKPDAKPGCNPNFYLDIEGNKHFKPECF